jgi:hypothetical protein
MALLSEIRFLRQCGRINHPQILRRNNIACARTSDAVCHAQLNMEAGSRVMQVHDHLFLDSNKFPPDVFYKKTNRQKDTVVFELPVMEGNIPIGCIKEPIHLKLSDDGVVWSVKEPSHYPQHLPQFTSTTADDGLAKKNLAHVLLPPTTTP